MDSIGYICKKSRKFVVIKLAVFREGILPFIMNGEKNVRNRDKE